MATRNRTVAFLKYREAVRHSKPYSSSSAYTSSPGAAGIELTHTSGRARLLPRRVGEYDSLSTSEYDSGQIGYGESSLPPAWVDVFEEVAADMQQIKEKMSQLTKAHSRALMPTFDESNGHQETVEKLSSEITRLLKKGEQKLKRLSVGDVHSEERRNVQRLLATDLQQLSIDFRKQQKAYLQRLQRQQEGSLGGSASIAVQLSERPRVEEDSGVEPGFSDHQQLKLKEAEGLATEREKEIVQIMDSVSELAQIMKDLSVLVIEQGTIIDRIDYNIENVATKVESGVKQLRQAEKKQKQSSMAMCIMVLIVLCLFMIVVLIIKSLV
ncbi:hypothetical protein CBR_g24125 [Chara braunii]|uniref:t-SNARE coiled-coil homology domain-containing protein n=1 Tax=Chara braunii TaxID=69332 RepID=A0A388L5U7_CHABU|nr:hypothetical protein CBR_g24125 [Chara braunii]|eukprot:GBG77679.1 hypothetical protein CBR_g24125 [Chara braunii]